MKLKDLKLEFFYLRKAFFEYKSLFKYIHHKYFLAQQILKFNTVLEKPINHQDLSIHLLTQHKDFIQTLWSLASFYQHAKSFGQLYIHNDGSLTSPDQNILKKYFPQAKLIDTETFIQDYASELDKYPVIKKFRSIKKYVLLKKLVDQYFVSDKKYRLIIDTDLLWFNQPFEIEEEIKNNCQHSLMTKNYALDPNYTIHYQDGTKLEDKYAILNSGIVLYKKDNFNLKKLENFLNKLDTDNNLNNHYIEQAGFACCLENLESLSYERYTIKNRLNGQVAVKHYTGPRRLLFYIEGIGKVISNL